MSSLVSAEITATCNALGYNDGLKYHLDPYCKESIRDLIRYLRRDDENHEIRRQLGASQVVQTDLLPILIQHSNSEDLFDLTLRVLVNLMSPVILLYREELPAEKVSRNYYLQVLSQLQTVKAAFTNEKVWKVLAEKLSNVLKLEWADRGEEKGTIIERILILARNVLHVPANANVEKRPDNDASVHDQVLWAMHQSGLIDLFLYLASSENETQYYLHILEIVSLMLREQTPKLLANVSVTRSTEEKVKDNAALLVTRQREIEKKAEKIRKYAGARHSRFGGSFVVKGVKSIGDRDLVVHKAPIDITQLTFDQQKKRVRINKTRMPMQDNQESRKSAFSIRLFLKEFCVEFLNGAYNPFMFSVREKISRGKAQPNDESYYFWALAFFMEFNRLYNFQVKLVSETLSVNIFHFVQRQVETWYDMMTTDKKKIPIWSKRMHLAVKAYKELMLTICTMDRSSDESVRACSKTIKSNIFYIPDYRDFIYVLLSLYNPIKFTRSYLTDLVETAHIFLKVLEHFCKTTHNMVVQGGTTKLAGSKKKKKKKKAGPQNKASTRQLEMIWEMVGPEVSALLQNEEMIPTNVVPFDAAAEMSMDQQKIEAMRRIRALLKNDDVAEAIGLLRAAREVWPENDCFGSDEMDPSDELLAVREIFMTDIGAMEEAAGAGSGDSDDESSGGEMEGSGMNFSEQSFSFFEYLKKFAKSAVVRACCELLDQFEKNSETTNHYVVKLLHRLAFDCKLPALVFQASAFRTFQRILNSKNPSHKELQTFAKHIIRKFVEVAGKNKLVFMELLFWKSSADAYEVEEGYGQEPAKRGVQNRIWTEEQEQELRVLFEEYERDKPETEVVEWIMQNLINKERTRRNVMKKMKELGLQATKVPKPRKSGPKSKNQKSHDDILNDDSDQSSHHSGDSEHFSDGGDYDSDYSLTGRAPHKSRPSSMNTSRAHGSDNDDNSGSSNSDDDNLDTTADGWEQEPPPRADIFNETSTSQRDSPHLDSDSNVSLSRKGSESFTPSQNSQRSNLHKNLGSESSQRSRGSDDENEDSFLRSLNLPSNSNSRATDVDKSPITVISDDSGDENSESFFLKSVSGRKSGQESNVKKRVSKAVIIDSSDEESNETLISKSPLQPISNSRDLSNVKSFRSTAGSDSFDEDTSKVLSASSIRKSTSRKRIRKVVSSDEENDETVNNRTISPNSSLSCDTISNKRFRTVLSSDEEDDNMSKRQAQLPSSSLSTNTSSKQAVVSSDEEDIEIGSNKSTPQVNSGSHTKSKRVKEINSSGEENSATPSRNVSLHLDSDSDVSLNSMNLSGSNSATKNTPNRRKSLLSNSVTPNSRSSLHLNSDSNNTPNSKISLHLNSDSNDTPNAKISLHLDSDSNDSPFKLNSSSFNTVNKSRKLRIDSDSD